VARRILRPKMGSSTFEDAATDLLNDYTVKYRKTHGPAKRRIELHLKPHSRKAPAVDCDTFNSCVHR